MKKCKNCEKWVQDYLDVCPNCGRPADRFVGKSDSVWSMKDLDKPQPVHKKIELPKTNASIVKIVKRILIIMSVLLALFIGLVTFFIVIDEDEERQEIRTETEADIDKAYWENLLELYQHEIMENAPINYNATFTEVCDQLINLEWDVQQNGAYTNFVKDGVLIHLGEDEERNVQNVSISFTNITSETYNALTDVVSPYVFDNAQTTLDQEAFNLKREQIEAVSQMNVEENEYYCSGHTQWDGYFIEVYTSQDGSINVLLTKSADAFYFYTFQFDPYGNLVLISF